MSGYRSGSSDSSDSVEQSVPDIILALRAGVPLPIIDIPSDASEQEITNLLQIMAGCARAKTLAVTHFYLEKAKLTQTHIDQLISLIPQLSSLEALHLSLVHSNSMPLPNVLSILAGFAEPDENGEVIQLKYLGVCLNDVGYEPDRYQDTFEAILSALMRTNIVRLNVELAGTFDVRESRQFQNTLHAMNEKAREQGFGSSPRAIEHEGKKSKLEGGGSAASSAAASRSSTPSGSLGRGVSPYATLSSSPQSSLIKDEFLSKFIEKYWELYNEYMNIDEEHPPVTQDDKNRLDAAMRRMLKSVCSAQGYGSLDNSDKNRDMLIQLGSMGTTAFMCIHPELIKKGNSIPPNMQDAFKREFNSAFAKILQRGTTPDAFYSGRKKRPV